jgi:hypothetical protein
MGGSLYREMESVFRFWFFVLGFWFCVRFPFFVFVVSVPRTDPEPTMERKTSQERRTQNENLEPKTKNQKRKTKN